MKTVEDSLSQVVVGGDSLELALTRQALLREASKRYQGRSVRQVKQDV